MGLAPGEWDPGWEVLKGLQNLGLVRNLSVPRSPHLRDDLLESTPATKRLEKADLAGPG
jgi:hypothetical protein